MKKSFIERIFPHSNILPQHEFEFSDSPRSPPSPGRITLQDSSITDGRLARTSTTTLPSVPLTASLVHHDDPFLLVERASRSLQRTIQGLLDAQSEGLSVGLRATGGGDDESFSVGSPTPTPSVATPARSHVGLKTIPIRQPPGKKITLRGARRGLTRSMMDFAKLKEEELRIVDTESKAREDALRHTEQFEAKKTSLVTEMEALQEDESSRLARSLRSEAEKVEKEIKELENRLFELKGRHRHLIGQISQLENSVDSKLSSYQSSLVLLEKEVKTFLRRPPVPHSLGSSAGPGMYALKPERRTLQMAQEQWTAEREMLAQRRTDVDMEKMALEQGGAIWRDAIHRINDFEKELRVETKVLSSPSHTSSLPDGTNGSRPRSVEENVSTQTVRTKLDNLILSLEKDLEYAESKNWNLLICCLGAELEAFREASDLLKPPADQQADHDQISHHGSSHDGEPPSDLWHYTADTHPSVSRSPGASSNHSLEDTLREFGNATQDEERKRTGIGGGMTPAQRQDPLSPEFGFGPNKALNSTSESEDDDDDPGPPDFFLSHA